jgi:hypothetical protein
MKNFLSVLVAVLLSDSRLSEVRKENLRGGAVSKK